jgi:hypothetical protein
MRSRRTGFVLGLHPSCRGFGWILFEAPGSPFDWGTADIRKDKNAEALARILDLIGKHNPKVVAMEAFDGPSSRRAPRIRDLSRQIASECGKRRIDVRIFTRKEIRQEFPGTKTRHDVAVAIARQVAPLKASLPKPRKIWETERSITALFAAAACTLTYFASCDRTP